MKLMSLNVTTLIWPAVSTSSNSFWIKEKKNWQGKVAERMKITLSVSNDKKKQNNRICGNRRTEQKGKKQWEKNKIYCAFDGKKNNHSQVEWSNTENHTW